MQLEDMNKFRLWAAIAGSAWGVLAFLISFLALGESVIGGLLVSPLIGLFLASAYLPAYKFPTGAQAMLSLISLYMAAALFGMAVGGYEALRPIPNRSGVEVIWQMGLLAVLGITISGYVLVLWPLAFFTHQLLRRKLPQLTDCSDHVIKNRVIDLLTEQRIELLKHIETQDREPGAIATGSHIQREKPKWS